MYFELTMNVNFIYCFRHLRLRSA